MPTICSVPGRSPAMVPQTTGTSAAPAMIGETTPMSSSASARYCRTTPNPPTAPPTAAGARAAGDRLADIEMNIRAFLVNVTDDGAGARSRLAGMLSVDEAMLLSSPFALIGSPAELTERLLERRERWGFSYVIVGAEDVDKFAPVVAALAGK